jgi:hypothetical protein
MPARMALDRSSEIWTDPSKSTMETVFPHSTVPTRCKRQCWLLRQGDTHLMRRSLGWAVTAGMALWTVVAGAQAPDPSWRDVKLATIATLRIPPGMELREDQIRYPDFRI